MSNNRECDTSRRESLPLEEVIELFEAADTVALTTDEAAGELDCSVETARRTLRALESDGYVDSRRAAGRVVWQRVDPTDVWREGGVH